MRIIVQKFGGTSLSSPERREMSASRVLAAIREGYSPVVVVSAMGRAGDPYATDTLLNIVREICSDMDPRETDLLVSCGEIISSVVMAATLRDKGLVPRVLTGGQAGIITDGVYTDARIIRVEPSLIMRWLRDGTTVIVAGFQGLAESGDVTTLGRGGSDITATALGAALDAELVEIYTDVDGIKTADPRLVPDARTIEVLAYDEICQMAHEGAKVIHPRAVEIAMQRRVPLRIKCTFTESPGTLVTYSVEGTQAWPDARQVMPVTGVTHIMGVAQVVIAGEDQEAGPGDLGFFRHLADAGISVDMINVTGALRAFIIKDDLAERAARVLKDQGYAAKINRRLTKVSVVGYGMRGMPGVMAAVVEALGHAGVEILQTADSHVTISCLVREVDTEVAVQALHAKFGLGKREV